MPNFAKIEIKFTDFTSSQGAELKIGFVGPATYNLSWLAEVLRTIAFEYTISTLNATDQAGLALQAIQADIANHGQLSSVMNVSWDAVDTVIIEANEYGWAITDNGTTIDVEATLTETPEVVPIKNFQLTGYGLSQGINPCSDVQVTIAENDGVAPYSWINPVNASVTLVADLARLAVNQSISITLEDNDTDQATLNNVIIPRLFTAIEINNISVITNVGGFDATVTAFMVDLVTFPNMLYSLNGSSFQVSNVFPNVVDGSYTLYVNDGFSCIITQGFTVDTSASTPRRSAYAIVPKAQSFRFIQSKTVKYNTLENTLYQDEFHLGEYKPKYYHPYQTNDGIITSQFRSNYDGLSARRLDCDNNIVETFSTVKKSDNLGSQDKRDCIAFNRGNNQSGVFFTSGNIYDPGTTDIIDTYELNGALPEWGKIGNTMTLTGNITGTFVIKQVVFDATVQANALIFDYAWQSGNQTEAIIAEVNYDRLNYEVHEFDFDLGQAPLINGKFYIQILMTDSLNEYPPLVFSSEFFSVQDETIKTNFIEWSASKATGLDYSTGFKGRIRLSSTDPYIDLTPGGESTEFDDSLLETVTLKSIATIEGEMLFVSVPRYMIEKLKLIFTHRTIFINGEQWTPIESMETINFRYSALKNASIKLRRNKYEQYGTDNIDIDGDKAKLLQESGSILI